jgi:hypothetical protein
LMDPGHQETALTQLVQRFPLKSKK